MSLFKKIRTWLQEPRLIGVDPDSEEMLQIHSKVLYEKPMMREVFAEFYDTCIDLDNKYFMQTHSKRVEIGAGVSFFKKLYPEIISTDIKKADNLDMVVDAQNMPFENNSVRAIYGINCFHHFPNPNLFFKELERVLDRGCGCVLIDPYYGTVAKRFYKKIFDTETFDMNQKEWVNESLGFMNGANQALSYIVFKRDKAKFEAMYPRLEIVIQKPLNNYMRYVLSGGLNFRQILPSFFSPVIKLFEFMFIPFNSIFALHHIIVIRKKH
ncbi:MAG: class I SAM-dependent methyltransferase [Bacteroidetes bacterium]|nr:class I SAM-dependent methyltransferase [Bacteroidota bacterium]